MLTCRRPAFASMHARTGALFSFFLIFFNFLNYWAIQNIIYFAVLFQMVAVVRPHSSDAWHLVYDAGAPSVPVSGWTGRWYDASAGG